MANPKPDFESAVEADYAALARAATVLCRSKSDVEDVLQETMLRAFKAYPAFRGGSSFLTWAYAILARVAQARNLSAARCIPETYALSKSDHLPPADRAVVADEEHRCLIDAIRALPERQREIVTLHFLQEVSCDEIALVKEPNSLMKLTRPHNPELALLTLAAILALMAPNVDAQKMFPLPTYREAVDRAVSAKSLKAAATKTTDPQVLLGLTFLAQSGDATRRELTDLVVKTKPEYAAILAVLALAMDGVDEKSIGDLIRLDPDNALGHYLRATALYRSGREREALEAFRKAAACPELRLYEAITGEALIQALDTLHLDGQDRLCALSWMASRWSNFGAIGLQDIQSAVSEVARTADTATRKELSDLLLVLAGHLFASNFNNRWYAERALESAFRMKAEIGAAEKSPTMNGYAAVVQALASVTLSWPGIKDHVSRENPLELARFLPSRIHRAFAIVDPSQRRSSQLFEFNVSLTGAEKTAFDKATEKATAAAQALIGVALQDPDGIVGAYLKGRPPRKYENGPWVSYYSPVEKLMTTRPEVFRAAAANEEAMTALMEAGKGDPRRRNMRRMMEVGLGIIRYASRGTKVYPPSLDVLFERGTLKPPLEANSLLTGKPYVYVGAGEKPPVKGTDWNDLVLLYDRDPLPGDTYQCVMADGSGQGIAADKLKEQLRRRGKALP